VRTSTASKDLVAASNFFFVASITSPNLLNSVLSYPKAFQISDERFSIARVLNPICKLLSIAEKVEGPATVTRKSL
jgi:hypothetical protein